MKKIFLIYSTFFIALWAYESYGQEQVIAGYADFKVGSTYALFGDNVKMRTGAGTEHAVIKLLKIGEKVEIVNATELFMQFKGYNSRWYKIRHKDEEGYILGALISFVSFTDQNIQLLAGIQQSNDMDTQLLLRTKESNNPYKEFVFDLIGSEFYLRISDSKGLKDIQKLISVDYISEACGVEGGISYFTWNGSTIKHFVNLSSISDAGIYSYEERFIFPDENGLAANKIVYKRNRTVVEDELTEWMVETNESRIIEWDGKNFSPAFPFIKFEN
ncbi:SH3 domain-containing protein [Ascidiimonas sp. W6]|uniref:SH3 domain-containing protein n=1 Tax=Ascidiimonas meishanensis TaxID=3128903 RepID=UPI0030EED865